MTTAYIVLAWRRAVKNEGSTLQHIRSEMTVSITKTTLPTMWSIYTQQRLTSRALINMQYAHVTAVLNITLRHKPARSSLGRFCSSVNSSG